MGRDKVCSRDKVTEVVRGCKRRAPMTTVRILFILRASVTTWAMAVVHVGNNCVRAVAVGRSEWSKRYLGDKVNRS